LVIPDGLFSRDGILDTTTAATFEIPVIDMTAVNQALEEERMLPSPSQTEKELPASVYIYTPYYTQAPDGNRKLPWSMLCSEANLALAAYAMQ
jgi:hypothetical protein